MNENKLFPSRHCDDMLFSRREYLDDMTKTRFSLFSLKWPESEDAQSIAMN